MGECNGNTSVTNILARKNVSLILVREFL
uniref:Uncharacterized protein n=1 Tax=Anguilla anguilla TaxID=7936 RepID=A0A0E9QJP7_ANGAN